MPQSFAVECPFCHAKGELADSRLLGQAIACPSCQKVFMVAPAAAAPTVTAAPPVLPIASAQVPVPVPSVVTRQAGSLSHVMVPNSDPVLPVAAGGPPEQMFESGLQDTLPGPVVRRRKPASNWLGTLAWSSISCTVLVWAIMFAIGDRTPKKSRQEVAKKETGRSKKRTAPTTSDWPVADTTTRGQQPNNSPMTPTLQPQVTPDPGAPVESTANIPLQIALKLTDDLGSQVTPFLIDSLAHPHAGVRELAAKKLAGREFSPAVVPPLLKLLTDASPLVREAAVGALAQHGKNSAEVIEPLGRLLQSDPVPNVRLSAANTLSIVGSTDSQATAVAQVLTSALSNCKDEDVDSIVKAFWPLGGAAKPAIPELLKHLHKEKWNPNVAGTLAQLGQFDELNSIISDTGEESLAAKIGIAEGIGRQRAMTGASIEILETLFEDSDNLVRRNAIDALRTAEPKLPQAVELLELAKMDDEVRAIAVKALAGFPMDPVRNTLPLLRQLAGAKPDDREELVNRIGRMDGVVAVFRLLDNPQTAPDIQEVASEVLDEYTEASFRYDNLAGEVLKIANDPNRSLGVRARCAMFVKRRKSHSRQIVQVLGDAIASESLPMELRRKAADAIQRDSSALLPTLTIAAERCEEPLPADATEKAKSSRNEFHKSLLRGIAHQAWYWSEPASALPRLIGAIEKCDPDVKIASLNLLADLRLNESQRLPIIPVVRTTLKDMDPKVRAAAAHALGRFGPIAVDAVSDLMAMLQDNEKSVVSSALVALTRVVPNDATVMQELIRGLDQPETRKDVVEALAEMGPAAGPAVPNLRQMIPQADESLLIEILRAFGRIGAAAKPAVPDLVAQLKHPEGDVRSSAAKSLGQLQEHAAEAIPVLVQMLSENEQAQEMAVSAFRQMGAAAKEVVPELEKLASTTQSARIKTRIESALASIALDPSDPDSAVIMVLLNDDEWFETMNSQPKDPATMLPALGRTVHNSRDVVRKRSWDWLSKLSSVEPEQQIYLNMLESDDLSRQATAAVVLERLPTRGDRPEIAGAIGRWTQFPQGRKEAIGLLLKLGRPGMPAVANVLLDDQCPMKERTDILYIIQGYHELDQTWLLPLLRPGLKSDSPAVRQAAAYSLAFLNPRELNVVPEFLEVFKNRADDSWSEMHVLREMANTEADLSVAIPELMKLIEPALKRPDGDAKQVSQIYHQMSNASEVLSLIGPRPEDAPLFRQLLRNATDAPKEEGGENSDSQHQRDQVAESALHLLGALGPQAAVTVPEIKAQLLTGLGGRRYDWASTLLKLGEPAIEAAVEVVRQADAPVEARLRAFHVLHVLSDIDERGVSAIRELLQDPVYSLRVQAAVVLVDHEAHREAALPVLSDALRSGKDVSYDIVVKFRKHAPSAEALPVLLQYVQQPDDHMFESAIEALLEIAPENPEVRIAALNGMKAKKVHSLQLAKCWEPLIPDLIQAVEQDRGTWRQHAAQFLGDFKTPATAAIPALRLLMEADSGAAGDAAAISLATIDPDAAAARVFALYTKTSDPLYRLLHALERLGPKAAPIVPKLLELLKAHSAWGETYPLVGSLGEAAKPLLPLVIKELGDYREGSSAHGAISTLGEHAADVGPELIAALLSGNGSKFRPGLLEKMGEPAQKAVAEMCLDLQDEEKQFQTVDRLRVFGALAGPATPQLLAYAGKGNPALRTAAINVLAEIESQATESVPVLAAALSDPDPRVAIAASSALSKLSKHAAPALPQVIAELERNRHSTAGPLIELLRKMGPSANDAIPALEQLKQSSNIATRLTARVALKKMKDPYLHD